MAYCNLSASPSASLYCETHLFCNSLSPTNLLQLSTHKTIPFPLILHHKKPHFLISLKVSIHEPETRAFSQNPESPDEGTATTSKRRVWVNPKRRRASKLKKKHYHGYDFLVKLAESLDSCSPVEEDISSVLNILGDKIIEQEAVIILNNMSNTATAPLVLSYFLELNSIQKMWSIRTEVILYNVTLKVFRKCHDLDGAEKLFDEMLERGVQPDNYTFSTIIGCARVCGLPKRVIEWFKKMSSFGCEPDEVTCSGMIDAYGRVGNVDAALSLYDRARSEKWRLTAVAFSAMIRTYGSLGNLDGCLNIYEEMKALGIKPNASVYNSLLDGMGRAGMTWQVKNIYGDMVENGIEPTSGTYVTLLRAYAKARSGEDALAVYREMKEKKLELSVVLYNSLLSMCADIGLTDQTLEIFQDMKNSGTTPDSWTFASLITLYSKSGLVEEAEARLNEMLEAGFEPNIFVLNSIIKCYGKAGRINDVVRLSDYVLESGMTRDELFLSCLLYAMTQAPKEEHCTLTSRIEKANPKLGHFVKRIVSGESIGEESFENEARELFESIGDDVKRGYCNCLIDLCVGLGQMEKACELFDLGTTLQIYGGVMTKTPTQWSLYLKTLSSGAALMAFDIWVKDINAALENGDEMLSLLGINTGHGKHKYSEKGLAGVFEGHLKKIKAPFHEEPDKAGWFL